MSKGRVLVIDDDEWVCRLLAVAMKEAGFDITITENAADGFFKAVEEQPDCIVCDVDLPDQNGFWVAKKIRSHPSRISTAPLIFLSGLDDREHRLEGFQVGGDAYLTKPFRIDEVVAQVDALIQMAARLKKSRSTLTSIPPAGAAMMGDLGQMSVGTLLTLLDLERRSGKLELKSEGKNAQFLILSGTVAGATRDGAGAPPLDVIRAAMTWMSGKFSFVPGDVAMPSDEPVAINALLMEAARLEDEARADVGRPSSSRLASLKEGLARSSSQRPGHTPPPSSVVPSAPSMPPASEPILPIISDPPAAPSPTPAAPPVTPPPAVAKPAPTPNPAPAAAAPKPPIAKSPLASPLKKTEPATAGAAKLGQTPLAPPADAIPAAKPTPRGFAKLPASTPTAAPKLPKPPLPTPKTGFAGMRSMSPARGIPVVRPAPPKQPEPAPAEVDEGWSAPPPPPSEEGDSLLLEDAPPSKAVPDDK